MFGIGKKKAQAEEAAPAVSSGGKRMLQGIVLGVAVLAAAPAPAAPPVSPRFNDVMTAVLYSDRETVSLLLDLGRWADKRDSNGLTPLMVAAMNGDSAMARLLLERGADPRLQAPGGVTALDFARQSGDAATTQLLQRSGAR